MKYLIGIDIGTSGTKSVLFDEKGKIYASSLREYPLYQPKNGWAEQNPLDWWNAVCETLKELTADIDAKEIAGIGLSGQMHGLVMLDENNEVIRNSIIWCDGRTKKQCEEIEKTVGSEKLIEITANPALEAFTASKILWVRENEPENYKKLRHILLPKDYIRFMLTGEYATEVSDASGMQLLDIKNRCWSKEICSLLDIDMSYLPKVYESVEVTGYITKEAAEKCGLAEGIPVAGGAGDNAAAAIGTGVCVSGKAFTTIGTSGVVFVHTNKPLIDSKGRFHTFCAAVPGEWHVMAVTQAAGLSLNWFKNNIANDLSYKEIDEKSKNIPIGCEKLLYLPYLMGERTPVLDSKARGMFTGLSSVHTKAHMARAVMEGVSYSLYNCLEVLKEVSVQINDMAICGGGGKSEFWKKMISDIYNLPLLTADCSEGPALGVAILAGCAAGIYKDVKEGCNITINQKETAAPDESTHEEYMKYYEIYKMLYESNKAVFDKLYEL